MSIKEVCSLLDIALQPKPEESWSRVAPSVLTDSRRRLDEAPLAALFTTAVTAWKGNLLRVSVFLPSMEQYSAAKVQKMRINLVLFLVNISLTLNYDWSL